MSVLGTVEDLHDVPCRRIVAVSVQAAHLSSCRRVGARGRVAAWTASPWPRTQTRGTAMSDGKRSLLQARPRIAEIRSEMVQGDVSAKDIEWLCGVAEVAADVLDWLDQRGDTPELRNLVWNLRRRINDH